MELQFYKYQGAGNDFVIMDNRKGIIKSDNYTLVQKLCDRHFGVGADGLMLLENEANYDFRMRYYNADGHPATMCGNGARCIIAFADYLGILANKTTHFIADDGEHHGEVVQTGITRVQLQNTDKDSIKKIDKDYYLNTGTVHFVRFVTNVEQTDVCTEGAKIRYDEAFAPVGTNVNFVQIDNEGQLTIRTYEKGVEDETLACGTGAVASVLSYLCEYNYTGTELTVKVKGGTLSIFYKEDETCFSEIWLQGPTVKVFDGMINI